MAAFRGRNFSEKVSDTWPRLRAEWRKGASSGHENGTFYGFIMRMVDQGTRGMRRNTWLPLSAGLQVAGAPVYTCMQRAVWTERKEQWGDHCSTVHHGAG